MTRWGLTTLPTRSVFGECDAGTVFDFNNEIDAIEAAQAIMEQVFSDGDDGLFGSMPDLTFGCEQGPSFCLPRVLFDFSPQSGTVQFVGAFNDTSNLVGNPLTGLETQPDFDTSSDPSAVIARFVPVVSPAQGPEPATFALFAIGLASLRFLRHRSTPRCRSS